MDNRNPQRSTAGANRLRTRVAPLPGPATGGRASDHGIGGFGRTRAAMPAAMPHDGAAAWAVNTAASSRKGPRSSFAFGSLAVNRRLGIGRPAGRAIQWDARPDSSWTFRRTGPHLTIFFIRTLIILPFCQVFRARTAPTDRSGDPLAPSRCPHGRPGLPETPVFRQDPVYEREIALRTPNTAAPAVRDPRETPRNERRGRTSKGAAPRPQAMAPRFRTPDGRAYPRTPSPPAERAASAASAFTLARPISVHSGSSSGMDPAFLVKNSFRQL